MSRESNRRTFTHAADTLDQVRALFPGARITCATQNGASIGARDPNDFVTDWPNYPTHFVGVVPKAQWKRGK